MCSSDLENVNKHESISFVRVWAGMQPSRSNSEFLRTVMDAVSDLDMKPVGQSEIELERESE